MLTKVEQHKTRKGLNLSQEVLDGVLHHSGYGQDEPLAATLEGQVIRLSDKIAYVQHDIDDSIRAGLLVIEDIPRQYLEVLGDSHSKRIGTLVSDTIHNTRKLMEEGDNVRVVPGEEVETALKGLRYFMFDAIYNGSVCQAERSRAAFVLEHLFNYYRQYPEKMSQVYREIADEEGLKGQ